MLARQRHELILEAVQREGSVRVRALAELLDVSDMTVRRDLDTLASRGLVDKVHGGAARIRALSTDEPGFEVKRGRQEHEKAAIARSAAELVRPGSSVGLTAGTTTWTLAKHLLAIEGLTVVTNGPSVARVFYQSTRRDLTVVLIGGTRTPSDALVGPLATNALASLHIDTVFMGVHGMDAEFGYTTPNLAEAEVNEAFVRSTQNLVVVADHTKWGTRGLAQIAPLSDAAAVVTDSALPPDAVAVFDDFDTELHLAEVSRSSSSVNMN